MGKLESAIDAVAGAAAKIDSLMGSGSRLSEEEARGDMAAAMSELRSAVAEQKEIIAAIVAAWNEPAYGDDSLRVDNLQSPIASARLFIA
jgi:hypothetical protein